MNCPYRIGYCVKCGKQSMVTDTNNAPVVGLIGTKLIWITLADEKQIIRTRIGTVTLCADCDIETCFPEELLQNLKDCHYSGIKEDEPEFAMFPNLGIEVIKTFGD